MSNREEIDRLTQQLRAVLLNKPISPALKVTSEDLLELQGAVEYIAVSLKEIQDFLGAMCDGSLNASPPGRHNFAASYLKELHSILKHLAWQTTQVAHGDYSQRVRFLGEFSDSFNILTAQLREREQSIAAKTKALTKSINLLKVVLDAQQDWVIVTDAEHHQVIYSNASAKHNFYDPETDSYFRKNDKLLMEKLLYEFSNVSDDEESAICSIDSTFFSIKSFPMEWEERRAFVHCIADVTDAQEEKEQLENMAFKDSLTVAYNRRFCIRKLDSFLDNHTPFVLVLIDLDGLKQVNDVHGHLCGDNYITAVADYTVSFLQPQDYLCRMGGDEFVLLLPRHTEESAHITLSSVEQRLNVLDRPYKLAISYGIVPVIPDEATKIKDLLSQADEQMYKMKEAHKAVRATLA